MERYQYMIVFVLLFFAVCVYKMKIIPHFSGGYYEDYLSVENTTSIKGIFICFVFFSHVSGYVTYTYVIDSYSMLPFLYCYQTIVTLFLFYSGYGIMESIKKKGISYVKTIPTKRIGSVLFRFDISVLIFAIIYVISNGKWFTIHEFLLSLIGLESLGNSNWYIFVVLLMYLFTYIAFIFTKNYNVSLIIITILSFVYIVYIYLFDDNKGLTWYDTVLCYPLGIFWSIYGKKLANIINKNFIIYLSFMAIFVGIFVACWYYRFSQEHSLIYSVVDVVMNLAFTIIVVCVTMKIQFNNKILQWLGKHLFEIYILQRIPMIILSLMGVNEVNIYLFVALSLLITIVISAIYKPLVDKMWKTISINKEKLNRHKSLL